MTRTSAYAATGAGDDIRRSLLACFLVAVLAAVAGGADTAGRDAPDASAVVGGSQDAAPFLFESGPAAAVAPVAVLVGLPVVPDAVALDVVVVVIAVVVVALVVIVPLSLVNGASAPDLV